MIFNLNGLYRPSNLQAYRVSHIKRVIACCAASITEYGRWRLEMTITTEIIVQQEEKQDDEIWSTRRKPPADLITRAAQTYNEEQRTSSEVHMAARVLIEQIAILSPWKRGWIRTRLDIVFTIHT